MALVHTEIEIAATPEQVRAVVSRLSICTSTVTDLLQLKILDFPSYPEWQTFIQSIAHAPSTDSPAKDPHALIAGDKLAVSISSTKPSPTVVANTANEFSWYGSVMGGALAGRHYFEFKESKDGKGTIFVHGEAYEGWMTWIFGEGWGGVLRRSVVGMYAGFCEDVKKRVEALVQDPKGDES
jgi:hypothetical protein